MVSSEQNGDSTDSYDEGLLSPDGNDIDLDKIGFSREYVVTRIVQAVQDPSELTGDQLEEISQSLCARSFEKRIYTYPISSIMVSIYDADESKVFIQSMITHCRQWFNDRETRLRSRFSDNPNSSPRKYQWTAFCSSIADFYHLLKWKHRGVKMVAPDHPEDHLEISDDRWIEETDEVQLEFADLLFDIGMDIVTVMETTESPITEVECLYKILCSAGKFMEKDRPGKMASLLNTMKAIYLDENLSGRLRGHCVATILELIELAASNWKFKPDQLAYYHPSSTNN